MVARTRTYKSAMTAGRREGASTKINEVKTERPSRKARRGGKKGFIKEKEVGNLVRWQIIIIINRNSNE